MHTRAMRRWFMLVPSILALTLVALAAHRALYPPPPPVAECPAGPGTEVEAEPQRVLPPVPGPPAVEPPSPESPAAAETTANDPQPVAEAAAILWAIHEQAVAADEELRELAERLAIAEVSPDEVAGAARATALEHRQGLVVAEGLAAAVPESVRPLALAIVATLVHRAEAADLAVRAAATFSEADLAGALNAHRLAVIASQAAERHLAALVRRYGLVWPPPGWPR